MNIEGQYFGRTDYDDSLKLQSDVVAQVRKNPDLIRVLAFEFAPVITLGIRGSSAEDLLGPHDIPVHKVPRGGQATLHSPGQIVIYPICNIIFQSSPLKSWVNTILRTSQITLRKFGKEVTCSGSGLFQEQAKVASIGLKLIRGISTFGVAINLKNDPELFSRIRPCGVMSQKVSALGFEEDLNVYFAEWMKVFESELKR